LIFDRRGEWPGRGFWFSSSSVRTWHSRHFGGATRKCLESLSDGLWLTFPPGWHSGSTITAAGSVTEHVHTYTEIQWLHLGIMNSMTFDLFFPTGCSSSIFPQCCLPSHGLLCLRCRRGRLRRLHSAEHLTTTCYFRIKNSHGTTLTAAVLTRSKVTWFRNYLFTEIIISYTLTTRGYSAIIPAWQSAPHSHSHFCLPLDFLQSL